MKEFNILFTNIGRRVVVIQSFRFAMKKLGLIGNIIGVDANTLSPAFYITDKSIEMCKIQDQSYIQKLLEICKQENISLLLSFLDTDLLKLADHRENFRGQGTFVMISSPKLIKLARDKYLTNKFFNDNSIPTPKIWEIGDAIEKRPFPLLIKPIDGSASTKVFRINNEEELLFFSNYVPNPLLMEFVPGAEFTLDIFIDLQRQVKAVVPRKRLEVREGEVSKSQISLDEKVLKAGQKVGEAIAASGGLGMINVQCISPPSGEIKFIEINPRFGGGCPLSLKAGYPFCEWVIQMVLATEFSKIPDDLGDGLTMLRYDEGIFIRK